MTYNNTSVLSHQEYVKLLSSQSVTCSEEDTRTDEVDGTFAIMAVVVPCQFTGGVVRIYNAGQSMEITSCPSDFTETTVLVWYTGVIHEIQRITHGYSLTLYYRVIHTTSSPQPAFNYDVEFTDRIWPVLLSYSEENPGAAPEKIIYRLDGKYEKDSRLSLDKLEGADARIVHLIHSVVSELGLPIGLGITNYHISGNSAPREGNDQGDPRSGAGSDTTIGRDESCIAEIQNVVDLNGTLVSEKLEFRDGEETVPKNFLEKMKAGTPYETTVDSQECVRGISLILGSLRLPRF